MTIINLTEIQELKTSPSDDLAAEIKFSIARLCVDAIREIKHSLLQAHKYHYQEIFKSAAFVIFEESMEELFKNSVDANANKVVIEVSGCFIENKISVTFTDDGEGFSNLVKYPPGEQVPYTTALSREDLDASKKIGKLGGANMGLFQAHMALSNPKNQGSLTIKNKAYINPDDSSSCGVSIIFQSGLHNKCEYKISDAQESYSSASSSTPVERGSFNTSTFLDGLTAKRMATRSAPLAQSPGRGLSALAAAAALPAGRGSPLLLGTSLPITSRDQRHTPSSTSSFTLPPQSPLLFSISQTPADQGLADHCELQRPAFFR